MPGETEEPFGNEPGTDFSKAENRQKIGDALITVRKKLGGTYSLFIGDKEVFSEIETRSTNPAEPGEISGAEYPLLPELMLKSQSGRR